MQLSDFSTLVLALTASAVEAGPKDHQLKLIDMLTDVVRFDAAWWGWSSFGSGRTTLVHTDVFDLPRSFESAFRAVAHVDPFIRHGRNLSVFAKTVSTTSPDLSQDYSNFLKAYTISAVLNGHCRLQGESEFNFFMSLYRRGDQPAFNDVETADFRIILRHLEQSLSLSLSAELRAQAPAGGEAALLAAGGVLVRATCGFRARLEAEGLSARDRATVLSDLSMQNGFWSGRTLMLTSQSYQRALRLVRLAPTDLTARLSPEERKVANLLVGGLSMRQIAERKGVSHNTVRNQVATIYRKTGASGKIDLIQRLNAISTRNS